jgi:hypothetical protein
MGSTRRGVVRQAGERIVDTLGSERGERLRFAGPRIIFAIGDLIVGDGEVRRVEQIAQRDVRKSARCRFDMGSFAEGDV